MYAGIDVGGTKIAAALVDDAGNVMHRTRESIDQSDDRSAVEQLKRILKNVEERRPLGIGIGIPGIADRKRRTVWAPNIRGWNHIPLYDELEQQTKVPIVIESDRNTAILGEVLFGAARGKSDAIFLILGTGIGAGILSEGRLIRGAQDIAGAVGWIPVLFRSELKHFEEIAAGPGIERIAQKEGLPASLPELASEARAGNKKALAVFAEVGCVIGQALATLASTFNPELIVLGGGVSNAWDLMREAAEAEMRRWAQPVAVQQVQVVASQLGEDAGILGAAAAARLHHRKEDFKSFIR